MADLVFRQGINPSSPFTGVSLNLIAPNTLREATASGNFQARDIVKISYSDTYQKAVYAVCTSGAGAATFQFDENIYPVGPSSITATIYLYNNTDVDEVGSYRIGVDVQNGLYSKGYTQYAANTTYSLITPSKRNTFFGVASEVVTKSDVVFGDLCDSVAYGVGFSDGSFDNLNNKFKSSLEFNIATR